jgi:endonuclease G
MPNAAGSRPLMTYMQSVDEVEQLAGIDFFYLLPDSVENAIEADYTIADWNVK